MNTATHDRPVRPRFADADLALLVLRLVAGVVFFAHGFQKAFIFTIPGASAAFAEMGVPFAAVVAPVLAIVELAGGALLVLGVLSRPVAAFLALSMLGAAVFGHLGSGFWVEDGGYEYVAVLAAVAGAIAIAGPGRYALSRAVLPERAAALVG
ncbi:DoxX family protein [Agromyces mediolanus]|uniref:Quinol oxidase n=1 Tax=Agromyces mediolanus TaxID=41986 RepID=A0A918KWK5_AGRME|nr:DoxX family protein [Agromyces mediolanus]GGR37650.1 quinol oxidase [Agromyces mediolanus]GLJ72948.1 quinol oxidase [Agromyces mediolanus]